MIRRAALQEHPGQCFPRMTLIVIPRKAIAKMTAAARNTSIAQPARTLLLQHFREVWSYLLDEASAAVDDENRLRALL